MAALVTNPAYQDHQQDHTWTHEGGGEYSMAISEAESYTEELWERPIEDGKFNESTESGVTTWTTTGDYYGSIDIVQASYYFDDFFFYLSIEVVGNFTHEFGSSDPDWELDKMMGSYYFYFGKVGEGENRFAISIDDPESLVWTDDKVEMFKDEIDDRAYGSGLGNTYDSTGGNEADFDSYSEEITDDVDLYYRTNRVNTVEFALGLDEMSSEFGWTMEDLFNADFSIVGAAVSNPSDVDDLFANANFSEAAGFGVEYDTMHLKVVPEPGVGLLLVAASGWLLLRRRRIG